MDLENLSVTQALLIYVGLPALIWGIIWFLWAIPAWRRQTSYRPGDAWLAEPEVFDGAAPALASTAAAPALEPAGADAAPTGAEDAPAGGTSARW